MITTCQNNCPVGYYPDPLNICRMCLVNCAQCTSGTTCNTCYPNFYLSPIFTECLSNCPVNYFPNQTSGACQSLNILGCASSLYYNNIPSCLRCDSSNFFIFNSLTKTCICKNGYKLSSDLCN
jgi:proprotein convertase subtilisin/kexin type 5